MKKLKVLDLFSGIGGFSLGLERTGGFETVAFYEIEEFPRKVLAKHWPDVPIYEDVRSIADEFTGAIDVICGGFPCQDISLVGKGAGLSGERSGLWFEYARIIGEVGPRWVIIENVSALRGRGLSVVLQNLSAIGYDAEWHCIPASYVGAPHRRDRIWIVAHCQKHGRQQREPDQRRRTQRAKTGKEQRFGDGGDIVADATSRGKQSRGSQRDVGGFQEEILRTGGDHAYDWEVEPDICRVADGVPKRVDRLRCLGNAVVPQVVTMIGNAILEAEQMSVSDTTPEDGK